MIIDSHCHLNLPGLKEDLDTVISQATSQGVAYLHSISTKISEIPEVLDIAEQYTRVFAAVGVHPNEVESESFLVEELAKFAEHPKVISLGETGLDYARIDEVARQVAQQEALHKHIHVAQNTGLPLVIHTRDAEHDTASILQQQIKYRNFSGVLHCFTGSKQLAKQALDLGFYISISGICTFKNAESLREIIAYLPLECLLVETDAPFLAPVPLRGKVNQPSYITHTVQQIAYIKQLSYERIATQTTDNFSRLFTKAVIDK